MVAVVFAESGGRTEALNRGNRNGTADYGLFQINDVNWQRGTPVAQRLDPETNAAMARTVYNRQGIRAWSAFKNEKYAKFLPAAKESVKKVAASGGNGLKGPISATPAGGSESGPSAGQIIGALPGAGVSIVGDAASGAATGALGSLDVGSAISEGINSLGRTLAKFANSYALWLAVVVCLILGIVILLRKPITAVAPVGKVGKVLNVAKAVTAK